MCNKPDCYYCEEMKRPHSDKNWNSFNLAKYEVENIDNLTIFKPMKQLKEKIEASGLKQKFIAEKVNVGESHLTMMLNGKATMPEDVRNKINELLTKVTV